MIEVRKGYCRVCKSWVRLTLRGKLKAHRLPNGNKCPGKSASSKFKLVVGEIDVNVATVAETIADIVRKG